MAYELMFGEENVPGCQENSNVMANLTKGSDNIEKYAGDFRVKAFGGADGFTQRRVETQLLRYSIQASLKENMYNDTLECLEEAVEIIGDFATAEQVEWAVKSLVGMSRPEEAIALAHHGIFRFDDEDCGRLKKTLGQLYTQMGYPKPNRFQKSDMDSALQKIRAINTKNWDVNLFRVSHAAYVLDNLPENVYTTQEKADFFVRLQENRVLTGFLGKADFDKLTASEMRFLYWFVKFCNSFAIANDHSVVFRTTIMSQPWYRQFISTFSQSITAKKAFMRSAQLDPQFYLGLTCTSWPVFVSPVAQFFEHQFETCTQECFVKPFDDFRWYVEAASISLLSGVPILAVADLYIKTMLAMVTRRAEQVRKQIDSMSKKECLKTLDVLVNIMSFDFGQRKTTFLTKYRQTAAKHRETISDLLANNCFVNFFLCFMTTNREGWLLSYLPLYLHILTRIEFLFERQINSDGQLQILGCLGILSMGSVLSISSILSAHKRDSNIDRVVNNEFFCDKFGRVILANFDKVAAAWEPVPRSGEKLKFTVDSIFNLAHVLPRSKFAKMLASDKALAFHKFAFEKYGKTRLEELNNLARAISISKDLVSRHGLATLLRRTEDPACRRAWSKKYRRILTNLGATLMDEMLNPKQDCLPPFEAINLLFCFQGLFCMQPPLISLDSNEAVLFQSLPPLKADSMFGHLEMLHIKLVHLAGKFATEAIRPPGVPKMKPDESMALRIISLEAGIILAGLAKISPQFKALQKQKTATPFLKQLRKAII